MSSGAAGQKIHAVLKCISCNTVWNLDVMAAKNMRHIFVYMALNNNERLDAFKRPDTTNAEEGTGAKASSAVGWLVPITGTHSQLARPRHLYTVGTKLFDHDCLFAKR
jgi:hypothetical protein